MKNRKESAFLTKAFHSNLNDFDYSRNYNPGYMRISDIHECRSDLYNKRFPILKLEGGVIQVKGVPYWQSPIHPPAVFLLFQ